MEPGTQLEKGKLYFTKNGVGEVIPFNQGWDFANRVPALMTPTKTHSTDVWYCGISRHISDIAENEVDALSISY